MLLTREVLVHVGQVGESLKGPGQGFAGGDSSMGSSWLLSRGDTGVVSICTSGVGGLVGSAWGSLGSESN